MRSPKYLLAFLYLTGVFFCKAQPYSATYFYTVNPQLINPASIVHSDRWAIGLISKNLPNRHGTFLLNAPLPLRRVYLGARFESYETRFTKGTQNSLTVAYRINRKFGILAFAASLSNDIKTYKEGEFALSRAMTYNGPISRTRKFSVVDISSYYFNHRTAYGIALNNTSEPFLSIDSVHRIMDNRNKPVLYAHYSRRFGNKEGFVTYLTYTRTFTRTKEKSLQFLCSYVFTDQWEAGLGRKSKNLFCIFARYRTPLWMFGIESNRLPVGEWTGSISAMYYFKIKSKTPVYFNTLL